MTLFYVRGIVTQNSPIFIVFLVFSILWIYEIFMQRKRFRSLIEMLGVSKNKFLITNQEFHGHEVIDIVAGMALGGVLYFVFSWLVRGAGFPLY
jgi:acid phosphatase family membrane protein YuiD